MLSELRANSQITIPKEFVDKLGLNTGDKLEIYENNGTIYIMPVVVYNKQYLEDLRQEVDQVKVNLASGKQPVFDSVDALFLSLEE